MKEEGLDDERSKSEKIIALLTLVLFFGGIGVNERKKRERRKMRKTYC